MSEQSLNYSSQIKLKTAILRIEQKYHKIDATRIFGECVYYYELDFDIGKTWVVGRQCIMGEYHNAIYLPPSVGISRTVGLIRASETRVKGALEQIHVFRKVSERQLSIRGNELNSSYILRNRDIISFVGVPVTVMYEIREKQGNLEDEEEATCH